MLSGRNRSLGIQMFHHLCSHPGMGTGTLSAVFTMSKGQNRFFLTAYLFVVGCCNVAERVTMQLLAGEVVISHSLFC